MTIRHLLTMSVGHGTDSIDGSDTDGWGCKLSVLDMAKIGQLLLMEGKWKDKQLIHADWIKEMSRKHMDTASENVYADWQYGYGYQMWQCSREKCFRADGTFGQYILVCPPKNLVAVIWCEDAFSQDMLNIFWEELYDRITDVTYDIDGNTLEKYICLCREWASPVKYPASFSYRCKELDGNVYKTVGLHAGCELSIQSSRVTFKDNGNMILTLFSKENEMTIEAGNTTDYIGNTISIFDAAPFIRFAALKVNSSYFEGILSQKEENSPAEIICPNNNLVLWQP